MEVFRNTRAAANPRHTSRDRPALFGDGHHWAIDAQGPSPLVAHLYETTAAAAPRTARRGYAASSRAPRQVAATFCVPPGAGLEWRWARDIAAACARTFWGLLGALPRPWGHWGRGSRRRRRPRRTARAKSLAGPTDLSCR